MAVPYKAEIEKLIAKAQEAAEKQQEKESDLAGQRGAALEEFANALEAAMDELEASWEG